MQILYPDNDDTIGSWTDDASGTTNIYQAIDEVSQSDSDYVRSENDPSSSVYIVGIDGSGVTDPLVGTGHTVHYAYGKGTSGGGSPPTIDITILLREGTTTRATITLNAVADGFTTASYNLSTGEANAITDYTNLNFHITGDKSGGARTAWSQISWINLLIPSLSVRRIFIT